GDQQVAGRHRNGDDDKDGDNPDGLLVEGAEEHLSNHAGISECCSPLIRPSGTFSHKGRRRWGAISQNPFSPCGRRWREAPDEGEAACIKPILTTPPPGP